MALNNKKGQIIGFFFAVIIFIAIWAFWLGAWLQDYGEYAIQKNSLTGMEAFFMANLNLFLFFAMLIMIFLALYLGGVSN